MANSAIVYKLQRKTDGLFWEGAKSKNADRHSAYGHTYVNEVQAIKAVLQAGLDSADYDVVPYHLQRLTPLSKGEVGRIIDQQIKYMSKLKSSI